MTERENNQAREFVGIFFARKRLILGIFFGFFLLTILVVLFAPPIYVAESQMVVLSKKVVQNPETGTSQAEFLPPEAEDLATEINILSSPALVRETIARLYAEGLFDRQSQPGNVASDGRTQGSSYRVRNYISRQIQRVHRWSGNLFRGGPRPVTGAHNVSGRATRITSANDPRIGRLATDALDNLDAEIVPGSNVIGLTYTHDNSKIAKVFLNHLVKHYLHRRQALLLDEGSSAYFGQKKQAYEQRLEKLRLAKLSLLRRSQATAPQIELAHSLNMVSDETRQLYAMQDLREKEQQWLAYVKANARDLNSSDFASFSLPQADDQGLLAQQERIARVQQAYDQAAQIFRPGSRKLTTISQRLDDAKQRLRTLITGRAAERKARVNMLRAAIQDAKQRIEKMRTRSRALEQVHSKVQQLNTQMRVVRQAYLDYSRRLEKARAEESTDVGQLSNVQVLNWASLPLEPAFPRAKAVLPIGLVAGLLLGLMVGYLREYFDHTFKYPSQVRQHLSIPVIASIVADKDVSSRKAKKKTRNRVSHARSDREPQSLQTRNGLKVTRFGHTVTEPLNRRRIFHLISPTGLYGAERVLSNQLQAMPQTEFAIGYFRKDLSGQQSFLNSIRDRAYTIIPIEDRLTRSRKSIKEISNALRLSRAEVLHCHGYKATVLGLAAATQLGIPVIVTQHGFINRGIKSRLYNFLDKTACRIFNVAQIVCVTPEIYYEYRKFGVPAERLRVLSNAVVVPGKLYDRSGKSKQALTQFTSDEKRPVILFVGRLSHEKGPDLFIDMIAQLRRSDSRILGVVVGDGPMRIPLLDRAKAHKLYEHIRFTGFRDDANRFIAQADLVVIPSRSEGIPMVLLEAMAAGTPVLATAVGGISQVLKDGETGVVVAPESVNALAEAALRLLASPDQWERLRRQAFEFVRDNHGLQRQAEALTTLYAEAVMRADHTHTSQVA